MGRILMGSIPGGDRKLMKNVCAVEVEVELLSTRRAEGKRIERIEIKSFETTIIGSLTEIGLIFSLSRLIISSTPFRIQQKLNNTTID